METGGCQVPIVPSQPAPPASLFLLPHRHVRSHWHCYSNSCPITVCYHNYPYLLTEEIYNRNGKKTRFSEVELWFLMYSLVQAREQAAGAG